MVCTQKTRATTRHRESHDGLAAISRVGTLGRSGTSNYLVFCKGGSVSSQCARAEVQGSWCTFGAS
eukprot:m.122904 g.122904  ORF g.122904 m.122904 type:complete len:66 (+) comp13439_c0_seq5:555-752(+)